MFKNNIQISVIVPVLNEREHVQNLVENLYDQIYRPIEVLFVDGGSTDGTRELLKAAIEKYSDKTFKLIFFDERQYPGSKSAAHARNIGIKESSGEYLVLLDADLMLNNRCSLSKLKQILDCHDFVRVKTRFIIDTAIERQISLTYPNYCHCGYRRWIFTILLFNEELGFGEDRILWSRIDRELGIRISTSEQVLLARHLPHTKKEYFDQAIWYAKTYPKFIDKVLAEKEAPSMTEINVALIGCLLALLPPLFFSISLLQDIKTKNKYSYRFLLLNFLRRSLFSFYLLSKSFDQRTLKNYIICLSHFSRNLLT